MDTLTERLERLAELQKKNLEPIQQLGGSAFAAFERMARKNYELMGDMVEYAVAQSRSSIEQDSPQTLYERQMSEARAFAERMSERAAEYFALAEQMRGELTPDALGNRDGEADDSGSPEGKRATETSPMGAAAREADRESTSDGTDAAKTDPAKAAAKKAGSEEAASGKAVAKKTGSKKATAKKAGSRKAVSKKATSKKATSKKTGSKKAASKKAGSRKTASGKVTAKKAGSGKSGSGK